MLFLWALADDQFIAQQMHSCWLIFSMGLEIVLQRTASVWGILHISNIQTAEHYSECFHFFPASEPIVFLLSFYPIIFPKCIHSGNLKYDSMIAIEQCP